MIEAELTTSRWVNGKICIIKNRVNYFRQGCDCNHTVVGFDGIEYEIFMKINDFKQAMRE